jgi:hypothetical protein
MLPFFAKGPTDPSSPCEGEPRGCDRSLEIGNDFFRPRSASRPARMIRSSGWGSPAHRGSGSGRRPRTLSFRSASFSSGNGETRSPGRRRSRPGCTRRARETPDHRAPRGPCRGPSRRCSRGRSGRRDSEVGQEGLVVLRVPEHVGRLEVAVNDAPAVDLKKPLAQWPCTAGLVHCALFVP